jgi:hypothetical protein
MLAEKPDSILAGEPRSPAVEQLLSLFSKNKSSQTVLANKPKDG